MTALEIAKTLYKTPIFVSHRVRCGKPTCRCATGEGHGGHTPFSTGARDPFSAGAT